MVRHGVKRNESSVTRRVTAKKKCKFGNGINNQPLESLVRPVRLATIPLWILRQTANRSIVRINWIDKWGKNNLNTVLESVYLVRIGPTISCACGILVIWCLMKTRVEPDCHVPPSPCALTRRRAHLFGFIDCCWLPTPTHRSTTSHAAVSGGQVAARLNDVCAQPSHEHTQDRLFSRFIVCIFLNWSLKTW